MTAGMDHGVHDEHDHSTMRRAHRRRAAEFLGYLVEIALAHFQEFSDASTVEEKLTVRRRITLLLEQLDAEIRRCGGVPKDAVFPQDDAPSEPSPAAQGREAP